MEIDKINSLLNSFKIKSKCISYNVEENYYFYDFKLLNGGKVNDLKKISEEVALTIKSQTKPTIKVIHELGVVRLEFSSRKNKNKNLFELLEKYKKPDNLNLPCLLGKQVNGSPIWMDISKNPHLLIAGTTGSGKSVLIHNILGNLLTLKANIFLIDPKDIEFSDYNSKFKNLKIYNSIFEANLILDFLIDEMNFRYQSNNPSTLKNDNHIILIIDEFSDLILQDKDNTFYNKLCLLSQKCRAAKIHIVLSTQRPSSKIIDGTIKANFPARISCKVASQVDSKVILDNIGAENLNGNGDALIKDDYRFLERFQVAYTDVNLNLKNVNYNV